MAKEEVRFMAKTKRKKSKSKPKYRKKNKSLKWVGLFLVAQLIGYVTIYNFVSASLKEVDKTESNGILITAAHLPEKAIGDKYELLYSNKERDIAYYLDTTYIGPKQLLQEVRIDGISLGRITESKAGSFTVAVSNPEEIYAGLSGQRVYDSTGKKVLGFVSAMIKDGKLYCISIE